MNYILGNFKCSGKKQLYQSEIEQQNTQLSDEKIKNVIIQAQKNKENLIKLDSKIKSESFSTTLQSNIENATQLLHADSKELQEQVKVLQTDLHDLQQKQFQLIEHNQNLTKTIGLLTEKIKKTEENQRHHIVLGDVYNQRIEALTTDMTDKIAHLQRQIAENMTSLSSNLTYLLSEVTEVESSVSSLYHKSEQIESAFYDDQSIFNRTFGNTNIALWNMNGEFPDGKVRFHQFYLNNFRFRRFIENI